MKPCPFCGSVDLTPQDTAWEWGDTIKDYHQVFCNGCSATGPKAKDDKTAIELWDKRVCAHECHLPDDAKD